MTKMYYGLAGDTSDSRLLSPAPQISINTEIYYSGDIAIGYTYKINLRGYATAYRKTSTSEDPVISVIGVDRVLASVSYVKDILSRNGSNLQVSDSDNIIVLKAKGGILKSLSINESPNNWMGYAEYTAEIEFNEVDLIHGGSLKTIQCSESFLDTQTKSSSIVDMNKYKIKEFSDNWNISTDDNLYNRVMATDAGSINIDNAHFNVTYSISATGKHFFVDDKLKPAWEQAKNFAQDRLYKQVTGLLSSTLGIDAGAACSATHSLSALGQSTEGLLSTLNANYRVYNETITCETSESNGTFSATYTAIIKRSLSNTISDPNSLHTFSKNVTTSNDQRRTVSISIQGNIEGLIEGGLLRVTGSAFRLPQNGSIFIGTNTIKTKYSSALITLNKVMSQNDLVDTMKSALGVTWQNLGLINGCAGYAFPKPLSFNISHDYHTGTIGYTAEYSTTRACGDGSYANITYSLEKPVPILAQLTIPRAGVLIQDIGTYTARRMTITIEGRRQRESCLEGSIINTIISSASADLPDITLPDPTLFVLTQKQRVDNIIEGTYSVTLGYIGAPGCNLP